MPANKLFDILTPEADRHPKSDRLFLDRLVTDAARDVRLEEEIINAAHAVILKWADLETKGRLAKLTETQLQGDFLAEVFGQALGYIRATENLDTWTLEQHFSIGGETPDAVLGQFRQGQPHQAAVIIELKGAKVHLDRDRSSGRSAVDQCWDYLANVPGCRWGIVSNMVSFRLYERDSTKRAYEHFSLQSLRDIKIFRQFYVLLCPTGLIRPDTQIVRDKDPLCARLLNATRNRQREVGETLYDAYSTNRIELIRLLIHEKKIGQNQAIEMAQRLFDRIIFIAFCEDRQLLPENTIEKAHKLDGFHAAINPRWQQFKNLFRFIDAGDNRYNIPRYNGGLFQPHPVDDIELDDDPWCNFFKTIGGYHFADEVNLDVLGHLFERSITEIEKLKQTAFFLADQERAEQYATMPQSVRRKQLGIYYTPPELTSRIVQYTIEELIVHRFQALARDHGISAADARRNITPDTGEYWNECLQILQNLTIVDPACGSGAFLFQAYDTLEHHYFQVYGNLQRLSATGQYDAAQIPHDILNRNIYGVDLSPEAVEITQLALWIRSAARGQLLANLSRNIVHGNSLVQDTDVHPAGFNWQERFPEVFDRDEPGFDCVIGNPPWERIKLQEREFFSIPSPEIATATNAAKRRILVAELETKSPEIYATYKAALAKSESLLNYCRRSGKYPLTGRGDINTYAVFTELAYNIVAPHGRVGMLTPSGIASDMTTKDFFGAIAESKRLIRLFDFENRTKEFFKEVDSRFKFCIFNFGGSKHKEKSAEFVFFAHAVEELDQKSRKVELSGEDIKLLNPNTRTCPIFRSRRDADITKDIYKRIPILIDKSRTGPTGNPWGISFRRMFDQTNDAEKFSEPTKLKSDKAIEKGNRWTKGKKIWLPVYEAKMIQMFDHRPASVTTAQANWVRQGQTEPTTLASYQNPEYCSMPRYWVESSEVTAQFESVPHGLLCFKDVTSPTNQRTMIAAMIPVTGVVNSAPIVLTNQEQRREICLLANLNSFAYDFVTRQKVSNLHLNFFIVEQIPTLPPDAYSKPAPWQPTIKLEKWISERVLKLSCTAEDMLPLADACDFKSGSFKTEYGGRLNRWDETERAGLMAELDAAYFHLYGIDRDDAAYILTTFPYTQSSSPLLPGNQSLANKILDLYDTYAEQTANAPRQKK